MRYGICDSRLVNRSGRSRTAITSLLEEGIYNSVNLNIDIGQY